MDDRPVGRCATLPRDAVVDAAGIGIRLRRGADRRTRDGPSAGERGDDREGVDDVGRQRIERQARLPPSERDRATTGLDGHGVGHAGEVGAQPTGRPGEMDRQDVGACTQVALERITDELPSDQPPAGSDRRPVRQVDGDLTGGRTPTVRPCPADDVGHETARGVDDRPPLVLRGAVEVDRVRGVGHIGAQRCGGRPRGHHEQREDEPRHKSERRPSASTDLVPREVVPHVALSCTSVIPACAGAGSRPPLPEF